MARVRLVYETLTQSFVTQKALNECGFADVTLSSVRDLTVGGPAELVIYDCDKLEQSQLQTLLLLRAQNPQIPVLILAAEISIFAYRQIDKLEQIVALQRPTYAAVFKAVLQQMLTSEDSEKPRFPRFYTDEPVRVVVMGTGLLIPSRMRNYSAGGAFLEYRGISLKIGDKIQLGFLPKQGERAKDMFQLQARVIWIKENENPRSPARGVGIQFVEA